MKDKSWDERRKTEASRGLDVKEQLEKYREIEDFDEYFRNLKMKDITLSDMLLHTAINEYPDGENK